MNKEWVIPDIHGCAQTLISLVENKIVPDETDTLIFIGDYIDRGPDSKGVIDYIMKLTKQGIRTVCLLGNHEEALLHAYKKEVKLKKTFSLFPKQNKPLKFWIGIGGDTTLESFGIKRVSLIPETYIDWIKSLELYYLTDKFVVVHAGLNFEIEDPFTDLQAMTKVRDFQVDFSKTGNRKIVHGHVQLSLDFIKSTIADPGTPFIGLDNGCIHRKRIGMGNLVALELNSLQVVLQPNVDVI
jgi:serine/threonine protein phosphatase 1